MRIRKWEIAVAIGFVLSIIMCISGGMAAQAVSDKLIRLHIIANSDSEEDQALKLEVRDRMIPAVREITEASDNIEDARQLINQNMDKLKQIAEDAVKEKGYSYAVEILLEKAYFPSKYYDGFSLPAGEYEGLKVIIGNGEGRNWWCVLFPPLCLPAAEGSAAETAAENGLSEEDIAFITEDGYCYKIKFKTAELYGEIKEWIKENFKAE